MKSLNLILWKDFLAGKEPGLYTWAVMEIASVFSITASPEKAACPLFSRMSHSQARFWKLKYFTMFSFGVFDLSAEKAAGLPCLV